jgi:hypothetical protein
VNRLTVLEWRRRFAQTLQWVAATGAPIVITRSKKARDFVVIVPLVDLEALVEMEERARYVLQVPLTESAKANFDRVRTSKISPLRDIR